MKLDELSKENSKSSLFLKSEDEINAFLAAEDIELDADTLKDIAGGIKPKMKE